MIEGNMEEIKKVISSLRIYGEDYPYDYLLLREVRGKERNKVLEALRGYLELLIIDICRKEENGKEYIFYRVYNTKNKRVERYLVVRERVGEKYIVKEVFQVI